MPKIFNITANCKPEVHYMADISRQLAEIKKFVDDGKYFVINRARQYGKTTTLHALDSFLKDNYYVVLLDFQTISAAKFNNENKFSLFFAKIFLRSFKRNKITENNNLINIISKLDKTLEDGKDNFELPELFEYLFDICDASLKSVVLIADEIDSATESQVFLDFLAQLRAGYINRDIQKTFHSVILAGVHDITNLKNKIRPEETARINSPWNIAANFNVDMSLSLESITGMLKEYEADYNTGMDINLMAGLVYNYTSGYPFLVSRICKFIDEEASGNAVSKSEAWTKNGFNEAIREILLEKNTLFQSLAGKLVTYEELNLILKSILFAGKNIPYNPYEIAIDTAAMFGFVKNRNGAVAVSNRIFEMWIYNYYLSEEEIKKQDIYKAALQDRSQFIINGHLDMKRILEKFVIHFNDLYGDSSKTFLEEEGRKYFLLYLRPVINGTGNYYIESRTRELKRTDVIVDYNGEQYIIEMKIWHGEEYNNRGEKQLAGYLDAYHKDIGYMVSFNFNKNKQTGIHEIIIGNKILVEAVV